MPMMNRTPPAIIRFFCLLVCGIFHAAAALDAGQAAPFEQGSSFAGGAAGPAFGTSALGSKFHHDLLFLNGHYGRVLTDQIAPGYLLSGRWMMLAEITFGYQTDPEAARLACVGAVARYVFETDRRWRPFVQTGAGLTLTDIGRPDLGSAFNFQTHGGGGALWFVRDDLAWTAEYRFLHYSNAGITRSNRGVNAHAVLLGLARFF